MEIVRSDGPGARDELIIDVRIADRERRIQLDTGSERSWLYGEELARELSLEAEASGEITIVRLELGIGAGVASGQRMALHPTVEDPTGVIGTLGMDFLLGKVASIDYVQRNVCVFPGDVDRGSQWPDARFVRAELSDGRLVLPWTVGATETLRLFFDTGTGSLPFIVDRDTWRRLTSRTGDEEDNRRYLVPTFHRPLALVGGPSVARLSLGDFVVDDGTDIFFIENLVEHPSQWPDGAQGLSGNSLFSGHRLIIDARDGSPMFAVE